MLLVNTYKVMCVIFLKPFLHGTAASAIATENAMQPIYALVRQISFGVFKRLLSLNPVLCYIYMHNIVFLTYYKQ